MRWARQVRSAVCISAHHCGWRRERPDLVTVCPEHHVDIQHAHALGLPLRIALVVEQLPDLKLVVDPLQTLHPRFYQALRDIEWLDGHHFPEPFEMHAHRNFERI